ncbi:MAG: thioredoxin family protein [Bacteroidota bacterium]
MRISLAVISLLLLCAASTYAQESKVQLYDPSANASGELRAAISYASATGKHVLVQVGGNWCPWCVKLDKLMNSDSRIDSLMNADYVLIRVNYSKENTNLDVLERLENPQRFGFPVLLVLDSAGQRLHTQDSGLLEKDGSHDPGAVYRFLYLWRPAALVTAAE